MTKKKSKLVEEAPFHPGYEDAASESLIEENLDGYETITVNFEKEQLYQLMLKAHEYDMTLNKFIEMALLKFIEEHNLGNV